MELELWQTMALTFIALCVTAVVGVHSHRVFDWFASRDQQGGPGSQPPAE